MPDQREDSSVATEADRSWKGAFHFRSIFAALLWAIFLYVVVDATTMGAEARILPLVIGIPTLLAATYVLVGEFRYRPGDVEQAYGYADTYEEEQQQREDEEGGEQPGETGSEPDTESPAETDEELRRKTVRALVWPFVLFFLIVVFGFTVAIPVFVFFFVKLEGKLSWLTSAITTAVGSFAIIYGFSSLLGIEMYGGYLRDWL